MLLIINSLQECKQADKQKYAVAAVPKGVIPVKVVQTRNGYQLMRSNKPYYIKGIAGLQHLDKAQQMGANSIRLYTSNYAEIFFDEAEARNMTVMLGLWMKPEYEGFDYHDRKAVALQKEAIRREVLRFRYKPSLLMWNLGNELDNHSTSSAAFQALGEIIQMVHELDPYHPVTTTLTNNLQWLPIVKRFCPELDVLSVNCFGAVGTLATRLKGLGWNKPYILGEVGATGWWEAPMTRWDAPLDQSSSAKADSFLTRINRNARLGADLFLGSYTLYWGQRFEQTSMWFSLFTRAGEKTAVVDAAHYLWTNQVVPDKAPVLTTLKIAGKLPEASLCLQPGKMYPIAVQAYDPEGDDLRVEWEVTTDVDEVIVLPQNRTAPEPIMGSIRDPHGLRATIRVPLKEGPYRLLVMVHDKHGSVATHSFPFYAGDTPVAKKVDRAPYL